MEFEHKDPRLCKNFAIIRMLTVIGMIIAVINTLFFTMTGVFDHSWPIGTDYFYFYVIAILIPFLWNVTVFTPTRDTLNKSIIVETDRIFFSLYR